MKAKTAERIVSSKIIRVAIGSERLGRNAAARANTRMAREDIPF